MLVAVSACSSLCHLCVPDGMCVWGERGEEMEEAGVKWWTRFPPHHFSLPGINHPHPIMIKSVA